MKWCFVAASAIPFMPRLSLGSVQITPLQPATTPSLRRPHANGEVVPDFTRLSVFSPGRGGTSFLSWHPSSFHGHQS